MKRLIELTADDLHRAPVWKYSGEIDETAVVEATDKEELRQDERQLYIARTQFALANGAQFFGFCSPLDDSGLDYLQPVILSSSGPVYFWFDQPPTAEFLAAQWERLGADPREVFPVHFRCTVPVNGRFVSGVVSAEDLTGAA